MAYKESLQEVYDVAAAGLTWAALDGSLITTGFMVVPKASFNNQASAFDFATLYAGKIVKLTNGSADPTIPNGLTLAEQYTCYNGHTSAITINTGASVTTVGDVVTEAGAGFSLAAKDCMTFCVIETNVMLVKGAVS